MAAGDKQLVAGGEMRANWFEHVTRILHVTDCQLTITLLRRIHIFYTPNAWIMTGILSMNKLCLVPFLTPASDWRWSRWSDQSSNLVYCTVEKTCPTSFKPHDELTSTSICTNQYTSSTRQTQDKTQQHPTQQCSCNRPYWDASQCLQTENERFIVVCAV